MRGQGLVILACAIVGFGVAPSNADDCSDQIARLEALLDHSMSNPPPRPMTPQSVDAQLHHQPTPDSLRRGEESAQLRLAAVLTRAKILSAEGKTPECLQSIAEARIILGIN